MANRVFAPHHCKWSIRLKSKLSNTIVFLLLPAALFLLISCGYHNPYVYSGPPKTIYIATWQNRTSELQLSTQIYQSLLNWYQRNSTLKIVRSKEDADLILGGEIVSIDIPSLSFGANNITREVKLKLQVRYVFKDLESDTILFQVPYEQRTEEYVVNNDNTTDSAREAEALATIIDELSQDIYIRTLDSLPNK
jgi:outer membrane lipopolysaccharide assembly protein LptE/RlpB